MHLAGIKVLGLLCRPGTSRREQTPHSSFWCFYVLEPRTRGEHTVSITPDTNHGIQGVCGKRAACVLYARRAHVLCTEVCCMHVCCVCIAHVCGVDGVGGPVRVACVIRVLRGCRGVIGVLCVHCVLRGWRGWCGYRVFCMCVVVRCVACALCVCAVYVCYESASSVSPVCDLHVFPVCDSVPLCVPFVTSGHAPRCRFVPLPHAGSVHASTRVPCESLWRHLEGGDYCLQTEHSH